MDITGLRRRADSGSLFAQSMLGAYYLEGIEVELDYAEAFRLLSLAARRGASRAVVNLARMYADGLGIPRNLKEATRLYEIAAAQGEFLAQVALGRIYSRLGGNSESALRWYKAAAAQADMVGDCADLREAKAYILDTVR